MSGRMQPKMVHLFLATALGLLASNDTDAQSAAVCAEVKIEILQRLTFERIAFDARLVVTNNLPVDPLENFSVNLVIQDPDGNDAGTLFFIGVADTENIAAVDGTASLAAGVRAEAHWLLIPVAGAGGTAQIGRNYTVGGSVNFTVGGETRELGLFPAPITVRPQPLLEVNYFLPAAVVADDPFTEPVEAPVPFSLGVRVVNRGFGSAGNLRIESGLCTAPSSLYYGIRRRSRRPSRSRLTGRSMSRCRGCHRVTLHPGSCRQRCPRRHCLSSRYSSR